MYGSGFIMKEKFFGLLLLGVGAICFYMTVIEEQAMDEDLVIGEH